MNKSEIKVMLRWLEDRFDYYEETDSKRKAAFDEGSAFHEFILELINEIERLQTIIKSCDEQLSGRHCEACDVVDSISRARETLSQAIEGE